MLGAQSAQPIGARGQLTASEAGYMTAPDRNVRPAANSLRIGGRPYMTENPANVG